uniref:Carbohydrate kinase PfkB domain-containing protein n=1 Tax=Noctiluca scintillans TaxID=2966 RepID=A0A7S1EVJ5_NOCSC
MSTQGLFASCETRPRVAVVGDIFVDISAKVHRLPEWDRDTEADYIEALPGGSALNQARQLHELGVTVKFFGAVGEDAFGKMLLAHVEGQGFPTELVKVLQVPSSICFVLSGPSDRGFVSCYSTTRAVGPEDLDDRTRSELQSCDHLHVGGYFNLPGMMKPGFTDFVRSCRQRGMTVSLNTQSDPSDAYTGTDGHILEMLPLTDLLFVNEREQHLIAAAVMPDGSTSPEALCQAYPELTLVVTRGEKGCQVVKCGQETLDVPTKPALHVVDATGAGDAFLAGFLSRWLSQPRGARNRAVLGDASELGQALALCCIGKKGACVKPVTLAEVQAE